MIKCCGCGRVIGMGRLIKFLKAIRNNWKKSAFAATGIAYGINYAKTSYETKQLMREYCLLATKYGEVTHQPAIKPLRHVTVILNPAANKRNARNTFEKYCAPLLHLAGLAITIVTTEYAGQARDILSSLDSQTDAIVVAGGDGTLSETVTGLLRRAKDSSSVLKNLPLAVLPLGRTNSVSLALLESKDHVRCLADATMSVVDGIVGPVDLIKVEQIELEGEAKETKPVYSLARVDWGSFRDAHVNRDKYWYFNGLREYISIFFTKAKDRNWKCLYVEPCSGCSKCRKITETKRKWWLSIVSGRTATPNYGKITNPNCGSVIEKDFSSMEFSIETTTVSDVCIEKTEEAPRLVVKIGPSQLSKLAFALEGWRRLWAGEKSKPVEEFAVREIQLSNEKDDESWFSIDNEDFEAKPIKITVLPKILNLYRPRINGYVS